MRFNASLRASHGVQGVMPMAFVAPAIMSPSPWCEEAWLRCAACWRRNALACAGVMGPAWRHTSQATAMYPSGRRVAWSQGG